MSKPSILLINRVYPPMGGATGRMLQDLARALTENGWRVTVLSVSNIKDDRPSKLIDHHIIQTKVTAKNIFGYSWIWLRLLIGALKLPKYDVVLTMTDPPMLVVLGRIVSSVKKSKHVHWCQDMYPDLFVSLKIKIPSIINSILDRISVRSLRKCNRIVVIGECMSKRLKKKKITPNKINFIPNWADFEVIAPSSGGNYINLPDKISAIAKKPEEMFRDDSPKFRILYAGTIGRAHPMRNVIQAAEILSEHKEIEFVFVGDKHAHSILAKERSRRGLENIKFIPFQPIEKLKQVMESGDLHLVTMRDEAQGMLVPCKFYSGLTVGRPTIFAGPINCEISNVIQKYNSGVVVPPNDGQALAEAIYQFRHDGDLWFSAQEGALQAAQTYHPTKSLQSWADLLERVHST